MTNRLKRFRTNAGDVSCNFLHCGDCVRSVTDERFTGEVLAISSGTATIRWHDTNWISEAFVHDLEKVVIEDRVDDFIQNAVSHFRRVRNSMRKNRGGTRS